MITELLVLAVTGFLIFWLTTRRPKNYPPGPTGWPIVRNLFQISRDIPQHRQFTELGKKYGDIVGLYFADRPVVVLNNYKHIKEAFAENVFSGRVISHLTLYRNLGGNRGLLLSEGRPWQEQRRFTLKTLRDFGFGKKSMEALIMEEVNELINGFKKEVGKPIVTQNRFNIAVLNGLWLLLTGNKFSHDDPRLNFLVKSITSIITRRPLSALVAEFFPVVQKVRHLFPGFFNTQGLQTHKAVQKLIRETIDEHKATLQEDAPRDFIDAFLIESNKTTDVNSSFYQEDGYLGLHIVLLDLFIAGAETTSTTLTWTFLTMALYPEKQEKLYEEIKGVVGLSRSVSLTDRAELPYLEACMMEMLRFSAVVATGVFHRTHEEFKVTTYDGEPKPTFDSLASFVLFPKPHKVVLVDRNSTAQS
ncbi:unnamed protein product [Allacma fusca]|uniref:Cytochrome P450 n=1 Tax=Allacma fusca TaxID=39272 RepID=A0A8J2PTS4_9HEXA|nr:unnamed protein product [Allacma fusca]